MLQITSEMNGLIIYKMNCELICFGRDKAFGEINVIFEMNYVFVFYN